MRTIQAAAICALLAGSLGQQAYGQQWSWKKVEYPGATSTRLTGISGDIAIGEWSGRSFPPHQFVYNSKTDTYTSWEFPGDPWARLTGISGTDLVGNYGDEEGSYGFLQSGNHYTTLVCPYMTGLIGCPGYTLIRGISGNTIVGVYSDWSGDNGFVYDRNSDSWTTLNYPGAHTTELLGVSGTGGMVGVSDLGGFLYRDGEWTTLRYPDAHGYSTTPAGISGDMIVGSCWGFGFLFDGASWTTLLILMPAKFR